MHGFSTDSPSRDRCIFLYRTGILAGSRLSPQNSNVLSVAGAIASIAALEAAELILRMMQSVQNWGGVLWCKEVQK